MAGGGTTTVSALARHLGVDLHTLMDAITAHVKEQVDDPARVAGVRTTGVDEHIWRPGHHGADRAVTGMVDLTRDEHWNVHARLLDVVKGRSGTAYATWLQARPDGVTAAVEQAALDPFRATPTPSAMSYPTPSPSWTPSTSCAWALGPSMTCAAGFRSRPWVTGHARTTRYTGSGGCCVAPAGPGR